MRDCACGGLRIAGCGPRIAGSMHLGSHRADPGMRRNSGGRLWTTDVRAHLDFAVNRLPRKQGGRHRPEARADRAADCGPAAELAARGSTCPTPSSN
eukprot:6132311-Alexandrium_andersonii.AAC.1